MKQFLKVLPLIAGIIALLVILALAFMGGDDVQVPCLTDAGTMSYSPTVCEKYSP